MASIAQPKYRRGSKKSTDVSVGILKGKPSIQVNWGGRIYGVPLSLIGSGNVKDSLDVSDIRATGNITFGKNSSVYNNSNRMLMVGGLTQPGDNNIAIGTESTLSSMVGSSGNKDNFAIGDDVMSHTINAKENIAIGIGTMKYMGKNAGSGTTATWQNVAIGYEALQGDNNQTYVAGTYNVAIGWQAMKELNKANALVGDILGNTCVGAQAGVYVSDMANTYIGAGAGKGDATGSEGINNVALGAGALGDIKDGANNVALGYTSLDLVDDGHRNIGIGYLAGNTIEGGTNNICIGYDVDVNSSSAANRVIISPTALTVDADNTTLIANTDIILDAAGDITLDSATGVFEMKGGGTVPKFADMYAGMMLGYTKIQNETISGTTNQTISITTTGSWIQVATAQGTKVSITFVAPPSEKVEIDLQCSMHSSNDTIQWSLSASHSSYSNLGATYEYSEKTQGSDESEHTWMNPKWVITSGITAGTSYTYYLWINTSGNVYIFHGQGNHHSTDYNSTPIIVKAIALPATIVTGE